MDGTDWIGRVSFQRGKIPRVGNFGRKFKKLILTLEPWEPSLELWGIRRVIGLGIRLGFRRDWAFQGIALIGGRFGEFRENLRSILGFLTLGRG